MKDETYMDAIKLLQDASATPENSVEFLELYRAANIKMFKDNLKTVDISIDEIDALNIIYISGTKGKGSVSAFCERILRANGLKTGMFSSPHLMEICERIRINGLPLSCEDFSKYFFDVYNKLNDIQNRFSFLTVMACHVFMQEKVDAVIMEEGAGGTYDCTNVIRFPTVTGINLIDFDHMEMFGDTLGKIAWHKAGICKPGRPAFTVTQSKEAVDVILARPKELHVIIQLPITFPTIDN
ncbi:folylpolyglutamate synthase, mitochondrial-like [Saccoglossus kowalevskii]|uniref:Folylpolyglutamate synthase, mitochondrial-like n=1 Tax=Saccoglossus kowalevskii TaxID=10224 RepID=A0ABM0M8F3_SACKO|nr:PREDICTED: folylpolyglutamate synthase, mitochondrial-like [Saccoglossus kowalevskii]